MNNEIKTLFSLTFPEFEMIESLDDYVTVDQTTHPTLMGDFSVSFSIVIHKDTGESSSISEMKNIKNLIKLTKGKKALNLLSPASKTITYTDAARLLDFLREYELL